MVEQATRTKTASRSKAGRPKKKGYDNGYHRPATGCFPEINRTEMARRLGCTLSHLSYVLKGRREPKSDLFMKLAAALKLTTEQLGPILAQARAQYQRQIKAGIAPARIKIQVDTSQAAYSVDDRCGSGNTQR